MIEHVLRTLLVGVLLASGVMFATASARQEALRPGLGALVVSIVALTAAVWVLS